MDTGLAIAVVLALAFAMTNGIHDASWCKKALGIDLDAMRRRGMHFP